ncbi:hypothetical protein BGZ54_005980 [Gamsiella multidivaricata]|nr:hypothetical protein BGZ54_005980 [Gamsiella multidivaricata]
MGPRSSTDLNELDAKDYEYLFKKKFATWGYEGVFKKRNGSKLDGCALFYRKDRVRAQSIKTVDYNHNKFITRENVGIVALFDIMQGTSGYYFMSTKMTWRGMMKIAQLRMLLEAAKSLIAKENMDIPIILCGDLNSVPRSAVINYLTNESIDVSTMPETHLSGQVSGLFRQGIWDNNIKQFHEAFGDTRRSTSIRKVSTSVKSAIVATGGLHAPSAHDAAEASISTGTVQSILTLGIKETTESSQVVVLGSEEMPECGPVISQPFLLESAYDINIPSLDAKDSNRGKTGQLFTTFHSGAKLICDYIFYGHLRTAAGSQNLPKLELVACLELPCRELEGGTGLPTATFGSDHLSLASKFRFTDTAHTK